MLTNETTGSRICSDTKVIRSTLGKAIGLMFSKKKSDSCLIFAFNPPRKIDLHMFFVFYSIDLIFLGKNREVIEIKQSFRPFTFYFPKTAAAYVIEAEEGASRLVKLGDRISF
ncbi:MAG: hypothetical protein HGA85_09185 [Nanoarchaeota archaeon]|nr:hypothetical protein [Nanoarchaeota archaeon]